MASECILDQGLSVNQHVVGRSVGLDAGTIVPSVVDPRASLVAPMTREAFMRSARAAFAWRSVGDRTPTPIDRDPGQASRPSLAVPGGLDRARDI